MTLAALFVAAVFPAFASASLADEQAQGKALAAEVNSGKKSCDDLSSNDFEVIGEYVMCQRRSKSGPLSPVEK